MKEGTVALFVLVALGAGLAIDAVSSDVERPQPAAYQGDLVTSRAVFCAPSSAEAGEVDIVVAGSGGNRDYRVGIETAVPDSVETESTPEPPAEVDGANEFIAASEGNEAVDVVGYDGPIQGGTVLATTKPVVGAGAAQCSPDASETWFFAAGSTTLDSDERILLYNPFPDEAVVRLSFYTPGGLETKTSVNDVAVPAGSWKSVTINEVIRTKVLVAIGVAADRGRVVAWREMFTDPKNGPSGLQLTLGARATGRRWYFPDGTVGSGFEERISILNPNNRQAIVEITLASARETIQPSDLMEATIPARSSASFSLAKARTGLKETTGVSATVRSTNGVGIVAERTMRYVDSNSGVTAEVGAAAPARRWLLSPASLTPTTDSLVLFNPGVAGVGVRVAMLDVRGEPLRLGQLQNLQVRAGKRLDVPLEELTEGRPVTVLVDANGPIVAERFSYSSRAGDAAALMGVPLRPIP
ncbi:MAG: DUF5719 family protein [Actinomycetota bacterium]